MNLTSHQYQRAAWHNGIHSGLSFRISLEAWEAATRADSTNGRQFDNNVTAAIQASEWLDRVVMSYRG
jgi:hypothetical protein